MDSNIKNEAKNLWRQEKDKIKTVFETLSIECGKYCYLTPWDTLKENSLNISEQEMENLINTWFN